MNKENVHEKKEDFSEGKPAKKETELIFTFSPGILFTHRDKKSKKFESVSLRRK